MASKTVLSRLKDARGLEAKIRAAFLAADTDGSGFLERNEMGPFLSSTPAGEGLDNAAIEKLIDVYMDLDDADGDGKLDFDEFVSYS